MNSNSTSRELASALFDEVLVPLAAAAPTSHLGFTAVLDCDSYFQPAYRPMLTRETMSALGSVTAIDELERIWTDEYPDLLTLIPHLRALVETIATERATQADDLDAPSTLIYQMW